MISIGFSQLWETNICPALRHDQHHFLNQKNPAMKNLSIGAIALLLGLVIQGCKTFEKFQPGEFSYLPLINEISPYSFKGEAPWVELYNPSALPVDLNGLSIVINDENVFDFPANIKMLPPNSFVLIKMDGKGSPANDKKFKNRLITLHSNKMLKTDRVEPGQVAMVRKDAKTEKLIGFIAWGAPGSKSSLTEERDAIWKKNWFVNMEPSFGDYTPGATVKSGYTIGLSPGSRTAALKDFGVYKWENATPGRANQLPIQVLFTISDNAVVKSEDIAIGWTTSVRSTVVSYTIQIARDSSFNDIVEEKTVNEGLYKPSNVLPEGKYYYRIKVIDNKKQESPWSDIRRIESRRLDDGGNGAIEKILIDMMWKRQRKDTHLLCLDGCAHHNDASTTKHWDNIHPDAIPVNNDHGHMYCVRTSISMMVDFYGRTLSIDRIAYFTEEERAGEGDGEPEWDLAHAVGNSYPDEETAALEWALGTSVTHIDLPNPSFTDLKNWLDNNQPIMTRKPGHMRCMNGYRVDDAGEEWVHIMDPWSGEQWVTYDTWNSDARGTWAGPVSAPSAREDEPGIWTDSDGDGIMDFDEQIRFASGINSSDSDNDDVGDKEDLAEYVFNSSDVFSKRDADFDSDGYRKETDPDNDGDGYYDGCEDTNFNGKYEPGLGETNDFAVNTGLSCPTEPIHAIIVFDRSGSMNSPATDPVKKYDQAASAAVLFLDTWLVNDPPANTKVGLVYYDESAYFDVNAATNTTLDILNSGKRDKINASFAINRPDIGCTSIGSGIVKSTESSGFNITSIPADNQDRVIIVLTDGKENYSPRMDDPLVINKLVSGKIEGYALGIGDETQIDIDKLNDLATILNNAPASLAKDLDEFQLEKFFLQILSETQGLEFSTDPVHRIAPGETQNHEIMVSPFSENSTFVVVWKTPDVTLDFQLIDPNGLLTPPSNARNNTYYNVKSKASPKAGKWVVRVRAEYTGTGVAPASIEYSLMMLENNKGLHAQFKAYAKIYEVGNSILLTANLSEKNESIRDASVKAIVQKPEMSVGQFVARFPYRPDTTIRPLERGVRFSNLDRKLQYILENNIKIPIQTSTITLNDTGDNGDVIPGDGIYSALYTDTRQSGIYNFRFISQGMSMEEKAPFNREKLISVPLRPRISSDLSRVKILNRIYENNLSTITFEVTPVDRFGNMVGLGLENLIRTDIPGATIEKVTDRMNGTYEVVITVKGVYEKPVNILPFMNFR